MSETVRPGYCCHTPALRFEWHLGTEEGDVTQRVVALTNLRCLNCGTDYKFRAMQALLDGDAKTVVLYVTTDPGTLQ